MNIYRCSTINSILPIRTDINTSIILLPTIILSVLCCTLFRTFQRRCMIIHSAVHLALPQLSGDYNLWYNYVLHNFVPCCSLHFDQRYFWILSKFQHDRIWKTIVVGSLATTGVHYLCPFVYNRISLSSNLSCFKVLSNINVSKYRSFGPLFLLMKSLSSSQCLTSVYETWSRLGARIIYLPFDT